MVRRNLSAAGEVEMAQKVTVALEEDKQGLAAARSPSSGVPTSPAPTTSSMAAWSRRP